MYLVFDIGGTKMRLATSKDLLSLDKIEEIPTAQNFDEAMGQFQKMVKNLTSGEKIFVSAGCVPGPLDKTRTSVVSAPNLPEWSNKPVVEVINKITKSPVKLENDAALAGLGEAVKGAGKGYEIVSYYTVSTGIGGCRIVKSKIDVSNMGFEPGQQIFDAGGSLYPGAKIKGNLESYVSGTAIEKRFNKKPYEIEDERVWDELANWLAYGIYNGIVHWSPDIIICGGSMILKTPGISVQKISNNLKDINTIFENLPKIVTAKLGADSGLYGALEILKNT
jgi:glucokinase